MLTPEDTLTGPLEPWTVDPECSAAFPLDPAPYTSFEPKSKRPEPVEIPIPVEMVISPPRPFDDAVDPASRFMEPPLPTSDAPTWNSILPAVPSVAEPVDNDTEPDEPLYVGPVEMIEEPLSPRRDRPEETDTEPDSPAIVAPD